MARTNYTSLGINTIGKNDADIEAEVFRHQPITPAERDAIPNPVNGMKVYNSIRNELEGYIDGSWPVCGSQSYSFAGPYPRSLNVVQTGQTEEVTITSTGSPGFGGFGATTAFKSNTGNVSVESTIKSSTGAGVGAIGCGFTQLSGGVSVGLALLDFGSGTGQLFDFGVGLIGSSFTFVIPYTISVNLNQGTAAATYEFLDNNGTTFSGLVNVNSLYNNSEFTFPFGITTPMDNGGVIVMDINPGNSTFNLENSSGKYCDYETKTFCSYDDASIHNTSGTFEVESGAIICSTSLATATMIQQTPISGSSGIATNEVEYAFSENAGFSQILEASFVPSNTDFPTDFCGVIADPDTQKIIDVTNSSELKTGVVMPIGYKIWVNFNLSGSAIYKDSLGNTGPLSVVGYTPNDNVFYSVRARADTLSNSALTMRYNSGEKEFADPSAVGKCTL